MRRAGLLRSTSSFLAAAAILTALPDGAVAVRRSVRSLRSGAAAAARVPPVLSAANHESQSPVVHQDAHPFSPEHQRHYELVPIGAAVILYGVTCCVVLAASALMVCCMYDAAAHWCHRSHFHSCQTKVQRVHEVFFKRKGEPTMCPYCVEYIGSSRQPVVFLCGHKFHMECANKWFRDNPDKSGKCPLCEDGCFKAKCPAEDEEPAMPAPPAPTALDLAVRAENRCCETHNSPVESSNDEALSFILSSLNREYPDIITEDCVKRWSSCHTEIWLSELRCPKYNSLLHKQPQ
mmetsp:Transcript_89649/g.238143  ORF Transcript_89649/g.238143 Transcript_89649/m.238143 type:complete len:292 (-) Transcript_89649:56-931(-)